MYNILVILHNVLRWEVLIIGVFITIRLFRGWIHKMTWKNADKTLGTIFMISIDLQILLGIVPYLFFSDWGLEVFFEQGFSFVMQQDVYRFFAIEHGMIMALAFVFAHLGSFIPKRVDKPEKKFKRAFILFGLALILTLAGIPWSRPLLPFL